MDAQIITDKYRILNADALESMKDIKGVDCIVTDPPYELTSGGKGGEPKYEGARTTA